ncbi:hypothetical protein [uncultured Spirosoma sp.]|uniref:hypothetical protein n=1 Tax=uncultured Spirosoma sp. TaxID=278208 RepID=UPI00258F0F90|nr:hypothetical protein [uncultured Spirosoma sp.]
MKYHLLFGLLCLSITLASGQSTSKIYLVRNGTVTLSGIRFYTTLDKSKPIVVKNNAYTVIETDADSLGILPDGPYEASSASDDEYGRAIRKAVYIPLEKGKTYYFKVGRIYQSQFFDVNDLSEQAFKLYVGINRIDGTPQYYFLGKSGNSSNKLP